MQQDLQSVDTPGLAMVAPAAQRVAGTPAGIAPLTDWRVGAVADPALGASSDGRSPRPILLCKPAFMSVEPGLGLPGLLAPY